MRTSIPFFHVTRPRKRMVFSSLGFSGAPAPPPAIASRSPPPTAPGRRVSMHPALDGHQRRPRAGRGTGSRRALPRRPPPLGARGGGAPRTGGARGSRPRRIVGPEDTSERREESSPRPRAYLKP